MYFKNHYYSGSGKINLFSLFIEKGVELLRHSNTLCYILPNTLLRVTSYKNIREIILKRTLIKEITDLDIGVFDGVTASTIILRLKNKMGENEGNIISVKKGVGYRVFHRVKQSEFKRNGYILDIFTKNKDRRILKILDEKSISLLSISRIIRFGVVISNNFDHVVSNVKYGSKWKRFLEGNEISSYLINYKGRYINYSSDLLHRSRTKDVFENEKIMIQRITGGSNPIKAVYDNDYFYNKESILNLQIKSSSFSYLFVLSLLNSLLINWFYKKKFTNSSKLTVNLSKEYLGKIPIKPCSEKKQLLISNISHIIILLRKNNRNIETFNKVINGLIFQIYFSKHMQEKQIDIAQFVENDLNQVLQNRTFEQLDNSEKETIIQQLHSQWTHPDNEVRNRIKLFAVRSPDILKPILESQP